MHLYNVNEITFKDVEVSKDKKADLKIANNNFSIALKNDYLQLDIYNASYSETLYKTQITLNQRRQFTTKKEGDRTILVLKEGKEFAGEIHAIVEPTETAQILTAGAVKVFAKCTTTATSAAATVTDVTVSSAEVAEATTAATTGIRTGTGASRCPLLANRLLSAASITAVMGLPLTLVETIAIEIAEGNLENVPCLESFAKNFLSEISWTGIEKNPLKAPD